MRNEGGQSAPALCAGPPMGARPPSDPHEMKVCFCFWNVMRAKKVSEIIFKNWDVFDFISNHWRTQFCKIIFSRLKMSFLPYIFFDRYQFEHFFLFISFLWSSIFLDKSSPQSFKVFKNHFSITFLLSWFLSMWLNIPSSSATSELVLCCMSD